MSDHITKEPTNFHCAFCLEPMPSFDAKVEHMRVEHGCETLSIRPMTPEEVAEYEASK